jgi:SAM-dependent methyltransferase/uncharacterized protein YbaR (Trm112 family)
MINFSELTSILCCPRCRSALLRSARSQISDGSRSFYCSNANCHYNSIGFSTVAGCPVLIDSDSSIFDDEQVRKSDGASVIPRDNRGLKTRIRRFLYGENPVAEKYCANLIAMTKKKVTHPRILIIGGGAIGSGTEQLYADDSLKLVGTDVYASELTAVVADAHSLPFVDESFDGVWIQAVLEHVLEPWVVTSEIHRVLKLGGVVYADTPFMQQVHEGPYDFTRFTLSGHRWLFRKFHHEASGSVAGAGTALIWSIRYLIRAIVGNDKIATLVSGPFFLLRYVDRFTQKRQNADAACGVFFFGTKSLSTINPKDMLKYYDNQTSAKDWTIGFN